MADSSAHLHEDDLSPATVDRHRAIVSIMEELEAADWYDQRVEACNDADLAAILAHNRDEEKEHAVMTLEWLRRNDSALDAQMRTYLFTEGSVLEIESEAESGSGDEPTGAPSTSPQPHLAIGSLRGVDSL